MSPDYPNTAAAQQATGCIDYGGLIGGFGGSIGAGGNLQRCASCSQWHYGYHVCPSGNVTVVSAPSITVSDVERIVAKALSEHDKKYLSIIEKLADALAGKK